MWIHRRSRRSRIYEESFTVTSSHCHHESSLVPGAPDSLTVMMIDVMLKKQIRRLRSSGTRIRRAISDMDPYFIHIPNYILKKTNRNIESLFFRYYYVSFFPFFGTTKGIVLWYGYGIPYCYLLLCLPFSSSSSIFLRRGCCLLLS